MKRLRISLAANRLGVHPDTLRDWADAGRIPFVWVSGQRRFSVADLDAFVGVGEDEARERREILYVRVSGTSGQETSLEAQETELRATATGVVVAVVKDRTSGLRENRAGLDKLIERVKQGDCTVVRVTHNDRLARFGTVWLRQLFAAYGVEVEVLHDKPDASETDELLADFMALISTFAGRVYGMRSRDARKRLLSTADATLGG